MTTAGDLNQRIRIDMRVKSTDTRGAVIYTWAPWTGTTDGKVWAEANPLRGRDFFQAAQVQSEITTRFRIRYRLGIDETMRVVWKGKFYEIKAPPIEVDGGHEWIDLMCKSGPQDSR